MTHITLPKTEVGQAAADELQNTLLTPVIYNFPNAL
jgi:hypothetical protein